MLRHVFKTGNSTVVSRPKEVLDDLGINDGESVNVELANANVAVDLDNEPECMAFIHSIGFYLAGS